MKCIVLLVVLQLLVICFSAEVAEVPETASLDELKKFPVSNSKLQLWGTVRVVNSSHDNMFYFYVA